MTQRHGIYSVPLPVSGKKVAASVVTLAAIWRSGRDSNPRAIARKLISSNVPRTNSRISPCNAVYFLYQTPCFLKHSVKCFILLYIIFFHHRATFRRQGNKFSLCNCNTVNTVIIPYNRTV